MSEIRQAEDGLTLADRTVIVTGGGRGIGRAIAVGCAVRGARVVVAARTRDQLADTVRDIETYGGEALAVPVDVARADSVAGLVSKTLERFGSIDAVVNNAGILVSGDIDDMEPDDFSTVLEVNVTGTFLVMQAVSPIMKRQGSGKIVNMASIFGLRAVRGHSAYSASKAAIIQLTKVAALELARSGVQVNAIAPGYIETAMSADIFDDPELMERVIRRIPARRIARPEELVPLVALLVSPGSDYMTGNVITIDGGFHL
jgi:NAD(P)-dependent dehydrogenase (short-subunit alcohol dehydrogenase family)